MIASAICDRYFFLLLIGSVFLYSLGDTRLLIAVCTSLARLHSLTIVGAAYCGMELMRVLSD